MKKFLAALLALSLTFGSVALPATESGVVWKGVTISASAYQGKIYDGDFTYEMLSDGTVELDHYSGNSKSIVIPSIIKGKTVTKIGNQALSRCPQITSISIPDTVTSIGNYAFSECSAITSLKLPEGVTSIGDNAFNECTSLKSINIPDSVVFMGDEVFLGCSSLTNITIPNSVTSIGGEAFDSCENLTSIAIPNSVTNIEYRAFKDCSNLANIDIPNIVTNIGSHALYGTPWLDNKQQENPYVIVNGILITGPDTENIVIPDGVTSIGNSAFSDHSAFNSVTIPSSVTSIGDLAFMFCYNLDRITIPNGVTSIGEGAFDSCSELDYISIPSSVTSFGENAFRATPWFNNKKNENTLVIINNIIIDGSNAEGDVVIPNNVVSIGVSAFEYNNKIKSVTIPDGVISIEDNAFEDCSQLENVTIPDSVKRIGDSAFFYCPSISSINIPDGVTTIGNRMFMSCEQLKNVTLPNSIISIGYGAFWNCENLTNITIPSSVKNIDEYAFKDCSSIKTINIPDGVENIGRNAFQYCTGLKSITIPSSVAIVGSDAFDFCWQITDVNYTGTRDDWNKILFGCNNEYFTSAHIYYNYDPNHKHSYTSSITKQPTCTAEGVRTFKCSCGDTYTETIPAKGHTAVTDKAVPATCTTDGKTAGSHCSVCGKTETKTIPAAGHKSSNWIVDKPAAIGVKGSKHKECTVCGKVLETAEIPALSKQNISSATVTLSKSTYVYDGKAKKPSVTVKLGGKTLKNGTDYTVSYSNNKNIGTATVKIVGKGDYTGTIGKTFKISPVKMSISKLRAKSKAFKASWAKNDQATGYEIQYSTNSKFKSAKKVAITKKTTTAKTITKLKASKKYFVRMRIYTTVNGKKYYGAWSAVKTVTTKK